MTVSASFQTLFVSGIDSPILLFLLTKFTWSLKIYRSPVIIWFDYFRASDIFLRELMSLFSLITANRLAEMHQVNVKVDMGITEKSLRQFKLKDDE